MAALGGEKKRGTSLTVWFRRTTSTTTRRRATGSRESRTSSARPRCGRQKGGQPPRGTRRAAPGPITSKRSLQSAVLWRMAVNRPLEQKPNRRMRTSTITLRSPSSRSRQLPQPTRPWDVSRGVRPAPSLESPNVPRRIHEDRPTPLESNGSRRGRCPEEAPRDPSASVQQSASYPSNSSARTTSRPRSAAV